MIEPPLLNLENEIILILLLLFLSAVTSGLNLGLMSLDMNELAVISSCGDLRERKYARTIAPVRRRGNFLLCSLLLGNVMVNSTLTVILEGMTSGVVAVIGSTLAIVVLGEIVPQAFCSRKGLAIGAKTIYLTYAFMFLTSPLSYPISCLLDCVLGEEKGNVYDRERLMEFIKITGHHTQLEEDEVAIISGALKLKKIKVDQIMTRIEDVFMLPMDCMLDRETIKRIIEKGYSRIPIYDFGDRRQIVALILAKDLALVDPDDQMPLTKMIMYCKHPLIFIEDSATLDVALNEFKTGKSHMAVVRQIYDDGEVDKYYEAIGIVTLEDVIEEVLQTEINDETDTLYDNRRKRRRADAQVARLWDEITAPGNQAATTGLVVAAGATTAAGSVQQQQVAGGGGLGLGLGLLAASPPTAVVVAHNQQSGAPNNARCQDACPLGGAMSTGQCTIASHRHLHHNQHPNCRHHHHHHHPHHSHGGLCVSRNLASSCQRFVVLVITSFEERFRTFIIHVKDNISKLFVSCISPAGQPDNVAAGGDRDDDGDDLAADQVEAGDSASVGVGVGVGVGAGQVPTSRPAIDNAA